MTATPTILFVADAGPQVGGGHVMRCLTLAEALARRGGACAFLSPPPAAALLDAFAPPGIGRVAAASPAPVDLVAAGRAAAERLGASLVVFDHYGLGAAEQGAIAAGRRTVVIDELADRPLAPDLLVDVTQGRGESDYAALLPPAARRLLGPRYALVRPEFRALRAASLARRRAGAAVKTVLVSMGLTDLGGVTAEVVSAVREVLPDCAVEVVLADTAPSWPALVALARSGAPIRLHAAARHMARLMHDADLAVGAGGGTGWERCTLGLPSLTVILAANQRASAQGLAASGATLALDARAPDFAGALRGDLARLAADPALRLRLAETSAAICDGEGAERVAAACLDLLG